jgi:hypothetical protein
MFIHEVKNTTTQKTTEEKNAAGQPSATTQGQTTPIKVSTSELFHRCGYIAMERSALKIVICGAYIMESYKRGHLIIARLYRRRKK